MHTRGRVPLTIDYKQESVGTMLIYSFPTYNTMLSFWGTSKYLPVVLLQSQSKVVVTLKVDHVSPSSLINVGKCHMFFCLFFNKNGNNHQVINFVSGGREELASCPKFFLSRIVAPTSLNINQQWWNEMTKVKVKNDHHS